MPKRPKIWRDALEIILEVNPPKVTSESLSTKLYGKSRDEEEAGRNQSSAGQLLRRLRQWGYLRPAGQQYPKGGGRPLIVYEPTEKARKKKIR